MEHHERLDQIADRVFSLMTINDASMFLTIDMMANKVAVVRDDHALLFESKGEMG
jgi:hypothetical protein